MGCTFRMISDDLLLITGLLYSDFTFIYGINFERHGVTYSFPPEVKIESRTSFSYHKNKFNLYVYYENEYYEHYGFVDSNINVWKESFEKGSIQRTNSFF